MTDQEQTRDSVTPQYEQHFDITDRSNGAGGKRVRTRLEQLLEGDHITPVQCEAGVGQLGRVAAMPPVSLLACQLASLLAWRGSTP